MTDETKKEFIVLAGQTNGQMMSVLDDMRDNILQESGKEEAEAFSKFIDKTRAEIWGWGDE